MPLTGSHSIVTDPTTPTTTTFKAATWNVFYGTPADRLEPTLRELLADNVTVVLMQEMKQKAVREMVQRNGLELVYAAPQYVVAWNPAVWERVTEWPVPELADLSRAVFYARGSKRGMDARAVRVILRHRASGLTIDALSYHTPAHVQIANIGANPRRLTVLKEAMQSLSEMAASSPADAVLYGGDDNVDEHRAFKRRFRFMLEKATGLLQVQSPTGSHGKVRRIDDFRVKGLKVGKGRVVKNASDHKVHVREFTFEAQPVPTPMAVVPTLRTSPVTAANVAVPEGSTGELLAALLRTCASVSDVFQVRQIPQGVQLESFFDPQHHRVCQTGDRALVWRRGCLRGDQSTA